MGITNIRKQGVDCVYDMPIKNCSVQQELADLKADFQQALKDRADAKQELTDLKAYHETVVALAQSAEREVIGLKQELADVNACHDAFQENHLRVCQELADLKAAYDLRGRTIKQLEEDVHYWRSGYADLKRLVRELIGQWDYNKDIGLEDYVEALKQAIKEVEE